MTLTTTPYLGRALTPSEVTSGSTAAPVPGPTTVGSAHGLVAFSGVAPIEGTVTEGLGLADVPSVTIVTGGSVTEGLGLADAPSGSLTTGASIAEGLGMAHTLSGALTAPLSVTEGLGLHDAPDTATGVSVVEGLGLADAGAAGYATALVEGLGLGESISLAGAEKHWRFMVGEALPADIGFSRASDALLVDHKGRITYPPTNLFTYSQEFDNAAWTKGNSSVTANATTAPDGTTTADKLVEAATSSTHYVQQNVGTVGRYEILSVYAKPAGRDWVAIQLSGASGAWFNVSTGVVGTVTGTGASATIEPAANGFYRCSLRFRRETSGYNAIFCTSTDAVYSYAGDGTSGVYLWGAQIEPVTFQTRARTYLMTTSAAYRGPRFNYRPATKEPRGLLNEETKTNLATQSEFLNGVTDAPTRSNITATSFAGLTIDTGISMPAAAGDAFGYKTPSVTSGTTYVFSCFVRMNDGGAPVFGSSSNSNPANDFVLNVGGTVPSPLTYVVEDYGGGLYRVWGTAAAAATNQYAGVVKYGTNSARGFSTSGWQFELGSRPSSYIPTGASQVSRSIDLHSITGSDFSAFFNPDEGTLEVEFETEFFSASNMILTVSDGTTNNLLQTLLPDANSARTQYISGGTSVASLTHAASMVGVIRRLGTAYKVDDFVSILDGGTPLADPAGAVPVTPSQMGIGNRNNANAFNGHFRAIDYYPLRRDNATIQADTLDLTYWGGNYETLGLAHTMYEGGDTVEGSLAEALGLAGPLSTDIAALLVDVVNLTDAPFGGSRVPGDVADTVGFLAAVTPNNAYQITATAQINIIDPMTIELRPGAKVAEGLQIVDTTSAAWGKLVRENVRLTEIAIGNFIISLQVASGLRFRDRTYITIPVAATEEIGLADLLTAAHAVKLIDRLGLTDQLALIAHTNVSVVERLRLKDALRFFLGADVAETLGLAEAWSNQLKALRLILETVGVEAVQTPQVLFRAEVAEGLELTDQQLLEMIWSGAVVEGVHFDIGQISTNGDFTAWAMNTRTGAVSEYQNFDFNSFARVGNKYLGASSTGVYELLGDTDDGDSIIARIRGGYMQFGGTHLSRLKAAYIAMRAGNDEVVLKIITADGAEYVYQVDTRSMRNTKVHMGKGMRARYFAFELVTSGQDFDLDTLEFFPIVMQRRV